MLDTKAAAARLAVAPKTVGEFCRRGLLPRAIPGLRRPLLFDESVVEAFFRDYLSTPKWRPRGPHRWPSKRKPREGGKRRG